MKGLVAIGSEKGGPCESVYVLQAVRDLFEVQPVAGPGDGGEGGRSTTWAEQLAGPQGAVIGGRGTRIVVIGRALRVEELEVGLRGCVVGAVAGT